MSEDRCPIRGSRASPNAVYRLLGTILLCVQVQPRGPPGSRVPGEFSHNWGSRALRPVQLRIQGIYYSNCKLKAFVMDMWGWSLSLFLSLSLSHTHTLRALTLLFKTICELAHEHATVGFLVLRCVFGFLFVNRPTGASFYPAKTEQMSGQNIWPDIWGVY